MGVSSKEIEKKAQRGGKWNNELTGAMDEIDSGDFFSPHTYCPRLTIAMQDSEMGAHRFEQGQFGE